MLLIQRGGAGCSPEPAGFYDALQWASDDLDRLTQSSVTASSASRVRKRNVLRWRLLTPLNYKYRLQPTEAQAHALNNSMRLIRWGWILAVRREKWARKMIRLGREANLHSFLADQALLTNVTGRRAGNLKRLIAENGLTEQQALAKLNGDKVHQAWNRKKSGLSVEFALAATDEAKRSMIGSVLGKAWAKLISSKGKFYVSWKACWDGVRQPPKKNKDRCSGWLSVQMQEQNPVVRPSPNKYGDNWVNLGLLMPGLSKEAVEVRFLQHRPLPEDGKIVELKITRHRNLWWLVFTVEADVPKDYPATGRSCGIDPGQSTPATAAGDDMAPGLDGIELGPQRPLTKALKKIRRLQRKLDRQRRNNNPECFREDGTWIKGKRLTVVSKGMQETEDRIASAHARCSDIRKDVWNKAADEVLNRYDTVYLGNWTDGTPKRKGEARKRRKDAFAETGEKRAKGQAAQQRTRERVNRDNALGVFRQLLNEKARRSATPKQVVVVSERNTTRTCCRCGAPEGPTGQKGLSKRKWTCPKCGFHQHRDRAAAWNILQAGLRQAGGQPVTEGRVVPLVADSARAGHGSAAGIERTSASSQAVSSSCSALAQVERGVTPRVSSIVSKRGRDRQRSCPQPLAEGIVSPSNDDG